VNIFWLDKDRHTNAKYHCDKHVVKMILEYTQLLSTAHNILGSDRGCYKTTHQNHPCAVWAREGSTNYVQLYDLLEVLLEEYTYRYGKIHKCAQYMGQLYTPPAGIPKGSTELKQCMPDEYKGDCPIQSYRNYYINEKAYMAKWKNRPTPEFMQ